MKTHHTADYSNTSCSVVHVKNNILISRAKLC